MGRRYRAHNPASWIPPLLPLLLLVVASAATGQQFVKLGIMIPYPSDDSAIPVRVANEWISAVRVALEVLNPKYNTVFEVEPFVLNSNCNYDDAAAAAQTMIDNNVVAVIGPACSEAARGAASVFGPNNIPFISFAATADVFASDSYPTFFRTVYGDRHQAAAMHKVIQFYGWKKVYLFYTDETYGQGLSAAIQEYCASSGRDVLPIRVDYPPPADPAQYEDYFRDENGDILPFDNETIAVFATTPNGAEGLWNAALGITTDDGKGLLEYPWWYLGTDGATLFDLVGQGDTGVPQLTDKLQGQIGLAPYKGDYNPHRSPFMEFMTYWQTKPYADYPGLLTLEAAKFVQARPYVTNLVDAFIAFYHGVNHLITVQKKEQVTADDVLACLRDEPPNCAVFKGCSGQVGFNKSSGDRRTDLQPSDYNFVNLIGIEWKEKLRVTEDPTVPLGSTRLLRPGPFPDSAKPGAFVVAAPTNVSLPDGINDNAYVNPDFANFAPTADAAGEPFPDSTGTPVPSPTNSTTTPAPAPSGGSSNTGAIVGLSLALVAVVAVLGVAGWWWYKRTTRHPEHDQFVRML